MATLADQIMAYLQQAERRDAEKGGDGWRSTSEITEQTRANRGRVYRRLEQMHEADLVEAAAPVDIGGNLWRFPKGAPGSKDPS